MASDEYNSGDLDHNGDRRITREVTVLEAEEAELGGDDDLLPFPSLDRGALGDTSDKFYMGSTTRRRFSRCG